MALKKEKVTNFRFIYHPQNTNKSSRLQHLSVGPEKKSTCLSQTRRVCYQAEKLDLTVVSKYIQD